MGRPRLRFEYNGGRFAGLWQSPQYAPQDRSAKHVIGLIPIILAHGEIISERTLEVAKGDDPLAGCLMCGVIV